MVILTVCNNILQRVKDVFYNALSIEATIISIPIPEDKRTLLLKEM
jgi:hypothetical protein